MYASDLTYRWQLLTITSTFIVLFVLKEPGLTPEEQERLKRREEMKKEEEKRKQEEEQKRLEEEQKKNKKPATSIRDVNNMTEEEKLLWDTMSLRERRKLKGKLK